MLRATASAVMPVWSERQKTASVFTLETVVGRIRVGCDGVRWQGATRRLAPASNEEQRSQRAPARLNRICSALALTVKGRVSKNLNIHVVFPAVVSGQLRFLG